MITPGRFREFVNFCALQSGFLSAEMGFVSSINEGNVEFDHLNYFVDEFGWLDDERNYMEYNIVFHAFAADRFDGDTMNMSQKAYKWGELGEKFDEFIDYLGTASKGRIKIVGNPTKKPDEDKIGNQDTLWLFIDNVKFRVFACKGGELTPLPEITPAPEV